MGLVPLVVGFLLLGVYLGVAATVLVINPRLAGLPWQEASEIVETVSRLADLVRMPSNEIARLRNVVNRFALEPQISLQAGSWLFGLSALALIVMGYRKIVECFTQETTPPAMAPAVVGLDDAGPTPARETPGA
jgi:hypothetical protein